MEILVDGHNALHRLGLGGEEHETARRSVLRRVRAVAPDATVFFDARHAPSGVPHTAREAGLRVVYCQGREADAEIIERVRESGRPHRLLVVTDDRELAGRVRQLGARPVAVREFFGPDAPPRSGEPRPPIDLPRFEPGDFGLPDEVDLGDPEDDP
ncbi:MAG: NYN domain-containing protein [Planctomycetota bacterium]